MTVARQAGGSDNSASAEEGPASAQAPRVSIIVINFNYAQFLRQAVDSASTQTWADTEVIVVDDCSTDGSRAVIESYGSRVIPVLRSTNGGMSASANSGFAASSGAIVMFLDADDYLHPDAAARVVAAWAPDVVQVQARLDLVDAGGRAIDVYPPREVALDAGDVAPLLAARGRYSTTVTTGLAFGRDALSQVMPIPEAAFDRSADGYLATVVPLYGRVVALEAVIGGYRRHDSNHSGFSANIAKRARWRVEHDEHRYTALRDHASRVGRAVAGDPGRADATHLEQRLASLCLEPAQHPYPADRRGRLGWAAARAELHGRLSLPRRAAHTGIALVAGFAPRPVARAVLSWKLEQSSRPRWVDRLAKAARRLAG